MSCAWRGASMPEPREHGRSCRGQRFCWVMTNTVLPKKPRDASLRRGFTISNGIWVCEMLLGSEFVAVSQIAPWGYGLLGGSSSITGSAGKASVRGDQVFWVVVAIRIPGTYISNVFDETFPKDTLGLSSFSLSLPDCLQQVSELQGRFAQESLACEALLKCLAAEK